MTQAGMGSAGAVLEACAALALVLGLIWAAQALARGRLLPVRGARRIALVETIALDRSRRVHLVQCDRRFCLLQTGGAQDLMIGWLPDPPPGSAALSPPP